MKKIALGLALGLIASSAMAGALIEPVMEQEIIVESTAASSFDHGIIPPIFFLLFVGIGFWLL